MDDVGVDVIFDAGVGGVGLGIAAAGVGMGGGVDAGGGSVAGSAGAGWAIGVRGIGLGGIGLGGRSTTCPGRTTSGSGMSWRFRVTMSAQYLVTSGVVGSRPSCSASSRWARA